MIANYDKLTVTATSFFRKMQEYGDNPSNGFMDNMKLDLIEQKQQLGEPKTKKSF
jgi:hypothetical protein